MSDEIEVPERIPKKNETIQYHQRHRRHNLNYIDADHWRNFHSVFASRAGLLVDIALSENSLLLSLATVIARKSSRTFTVKQE